MAFRTRKFMFKINKGMISEKLKKNSNTENTVSRVEKFVVCVCVTLVPVNNNTSR